MSELRCPVCDQPFAAAKSPAKPFCSERCRRIDLSRWLDERYGLAYERLDHESELSEDGLLES
jgi:uncharacterized protein